MNRAAVAQRIEWEPKALLSETLPLDPYESAKVAGLRYVTVNGNDIRRRRAGKGWVFLESDGTPIKDRKQVERIKALVIPPAWRDVWICRSPAGHLQAVGIDARGRKQYRYHTLYREVRDATKFTRMAAFGAALPSIRARVEEDLRLQGLPRNKVLATVVRLLEQTSIRVGNEEYVRENESFGLTTLRSHHVKIEGRTLKFRFKGKSGQEHDIVLSDRRLARIVAECQDIPGQELFQYLDAEGEPVKVYSEEVNEYIKEIAGEEFTAKDFRTWNGSREALVALYALGRADTQTEIKKNVVAAVKQVAATLKNRPATCRKYYIHPAVMDAYADGTLFQSMENAKPQEVQHGLSREEMALLRIVIADIPGHKAPIKTI